jgi:ribonuclease P protein subunit POP4
VTAALENFARHELIGLMARVSESTNPSMTGLSGKIVDETRNLLIIETERGEKCIPKNNVSLIFALSNGSKVRVNGSILVSQPENRIGKKIQRKRWKL